MLEFVAHESSAENELVEFLCASRWPFHSEEALSAPAAWEFVKSGLYETSSSSQTFWITDQGSRIGVVRLFDIADPTPMFDLRFSEAARGRGFGHETTLWLTAHIFEERPTANRIEATTRQDNWAMRRVLHKSGYAKEAHYREAWPGPDRVYDAVGYAILRSDWSKGTVTLPDWSDSPS